MSQTCWDHSRWMFYPVGIGHLSWFDHLSLASTLIHPLSEHHNSSSSDYIQLTIPHTHTDTHIHQTLLDCNYLERTQRKRKEKNLLLCMCAFHLTTCTLSFLIKFFNSSKWSLALPFRLWIMEPLQSDLSVRWSNRVGFSKVKACFSLHHCVLCTLLRLH